MDNSQQQTLKECPFCGKPAKQEYGATDGTFYISCSDECFVGPCSSSDRLDEAKEAWNRRAIREELSGWIACSERLPEDDGEVLMIGRWGWRGEAVLDIGRYDHQQRWWRPRGSNGDFSDRMIAWMPLPKAPKP